MCERAAGGRAREPPPLAAGRAGAGVSTRPAAARRRRTGRGAAGPHTMALAEVVVCAVGRVVTLPAVEITAQATALLVLVMLSAAAAAEDNGRGSPALCSGPRDR